MSNFKSAKANKSGKYRVYGGSLGRVAIATRADQKDERLQEDTLLEVKGIGGFKTEILAGEVNFYTFPTTNYN